MRGNKKRGQQILGMPFEIIFAIFLIIVFIVIAFIAISGFLDIGKTASVGTFYEDMQKAVDTAWASQSGESTFEIDLPSGITRVCFANLTAVIKGSYQEQYQMIKNYEVYNANTFLVPPQFAEKLEWKMINHLDIVNITKLQNPNCFLADGDLKIKKDFYGKYVMIG